MELKIFCPQWGHEHLDTETFFAKVKASGYDVVDTWLPDNRQDRERFIRSLGQYDLSMVSHQHQAKGNGMEVVRIY